MLRIKAIKNAKQAETYYAKSDGGYYLGKDELRCEWGGRGAEFLGLSGPPDFEQFKRLIHGLDPHTGEQLTAKLIEDRIPGWDINVSCPKGVTTALERGDERLREALWEAGREAMADVERMATTRVRKGKKNDDRITGNLVWYGVEHFEGRPTREDNMPDWQRHLHFVVFNQTKDFEEGGQWKALKMRPVYDVKKYLDRRFNQRFSKKVADLGYEIETKWESDGKGGRKYVTWDIKGIPTPVLDRFSRRTQEVQGIEKEIVREIKERDPDAPDRLSAVARDKLGATSRRFKRKDLTLADYRAYWNARVTPEEGRQIAQTIKRAMLGQNPRPVSRTAEAVRYALSHHFERNSVVGVKDIAITAMERTMGSGLPGDVLPEARRQGLLVKGDEATTKDVLAQEDRVIAFARAGRGTMRPVGPAHGEPEPDLSGLSDEQRRAVRHVWKSSDQLMLIRGGAGTGKTTMMTPALAKLGAPAVLLAPSSDASRGELRDKGFKEANTVAHFLGNGKMQEKIRGGGVIWVDEASMLPVKDLEALCSVAKNLEARIVLQGDPRQHKAVQRHGNMLTVLADYAGVKVAELKEIQRQKGDYAKAVAAIRDGDLKQGDTGLRKLGWIVEGNGHDRIVEEYARAIEETRPGGERKTVLVIDPTHKDGDVLSEKLRKLRKDKGLIDREERTFLRLAAVDMTEAQKSDPGNYRGDEVVQFFRRCGPFKAGERVKASDLLPRLKSVKPEHFAVYREQTINLAKGDTVRITAGGRDITGKHRIDNGRLDEIAGFTQDGNPVLSNGWVLDRDFAHIKHGLVSTSPASQSKTFDIVLAAMNRASLGAMSAPQGYVTISRGRERGMLFSDMRREELLEAIRRPDGRKSATELMHKPRPLTKAKNRVAEKARKFVERVQFTYRQLREKAAAAMPEPFTQREPGHAR